MIKRLYQSELPLTDAAARLREAIDCVLRLATAAAHAQARVAEFIEAETLMSALPIAAGEFSTARCRLRNALQYYEGGEPGAACYELRLLAGQLQPLPVTEFGPRASRKPVSK